MNITLKSIILNKLYIYVQMRYIIHGILCFTNLYNAMFIEVIAFMKVYFLFCLKVINIFIITINLYISIGI